MVFVRVRDEDTINLRFTLFQPSDVRQNQVNTGRGIHIWECYAKIDNDQALFTWLAVSVNVCVHANLTSPTKGQID
jgi:hypothetical protein